jgi:hypothetical protein
MSTSRSSTRDISRRIPLPTPLNRPLCISTHTFMCACGSLGPPVFMSCSFVLLLSTHCQTSGDADVLCQQTAFCPPFDPATILLSFPCNVPAPSPKPLCPVSCARAAILRADATGTGRFFPARRFSIYTPICTRFTVPPPPRVSISSCAQCNNNSMCLSGAVCRSGELAVCRTARAAAKERRPIFLVGGVGVCVLAGPPRE